MQSLANAYAFMLLAGAILGILAAHLPSWLGHPWSFCVMGGDTFQCLLVVHFFEVPVLLFNTFIAWYLLKKYEYKTRVRTYYLVSFLVALDLAFFAYEIGSTLVGIRRLAPMYETLILLTIALTSLSFSLLGIYLLYNMLPSVFLWRGLPVQGNNLPELGEDGFYHPNSEADISNLIKYAVNNKLKVRVRGATHSVAWAIYSDQGFQPNSTTIQQAPGGGNINIMMDRMNKFTWIDEEKGVAEVEAGIHIGVDPYDPSDESNLNNSLLLQAADKGWTLSDLGGITHQTIGGFLSTGSAGGSLKSSLEANFLAFRIMDGTGDAKWIVESENEDLFRAAGVSLGLLGIITKVRIQFSENFNIRGQEIIVPQYLDTDSRSPGNAEHKYCPCPVDLTGHGTIHYPSLQTFFEQNHYSRILWYPQEGIERLAIWTAEQVPLHETFQNGIARAYKEFTRNRFTTYLEEIGAALLFTIAGNRGFFTIWAKTGSAFSNLYTDVHWLWSKRLGSFLSYLFTGLFVSVLWILSILLIVLPFSLFRKLYLKLFPKLLGMLQSRTKIKDLREVQFHDYMWRSLPMDNQASDIMMGIEFTEIWIPLEYTQQVMALMSDYFKDNGLSATGFSMTELYAGKKSKFWLSPAYAEDDSDHGNVLRVDLFWYRANEGDPSDCGGFYDQFWRLFRNNGIPYRLHWAKFLPNYDQKEWAGYLKSQYPMWDAFMEIRKKQDPHNVFLSDYWKRRMDISDSELLPSPERALVISGGGARGAWGVGVAEALCQQLEHKYQLVVGTSTGSLMGPSVLLNKFNDLRKQYTEITQKDIFNVNPFTKKGNIRPLLFLWRLLTGKDTVGETFNLRRRIMEDFTFDDFLKIKEEGLEFTAAVTSLTTSRPGFKSTQDYSYDDMIDWIWASANTPVFMSNLYKEGEVWVDGGLRVFIPIAYAVERGAKTIDIIVHDNENFGTVTWSQKGGFFDLLLRVLAIYYTGTGIANVEDLGLEDVTAATDHTLNFYFMSQKELDLIGNDLVMDHLKMKTILDQGKNDLVHGKIRTKTCTIRKGDTLGTIKLSSL